MLWVTSSNTTWYEEALKVSNECDYCINVLIYFSAALVKVAR